MATRRPRPIASFLPGALLDAAMTVVVFVAEQQLNRRMGRKGTQELATTEPAEPGGTRDGASA